MSNLHTPWALALLAAIPVVVFLHLRPGRRPALRFSSVERVKELAPSVFYHMRHTPLFLRIAVLVLLIIAIARPRLGTERIVEHSRGVALEMVIDRSGSMGAEMRYAGERLNRFEVVKRVFREFVLGNDGELEGRPSDLIGMITFALYPDTVCPLTHNHDALVQFVDSADLVGLQSENKTAIGDAIALAAARLKTAEEDLRRRRLQTGEESFTIKSKAIILLTDGQNNAGKRTPIEAAKLAAEWGIKIYCIGIGGGKPASAIDMFFGRQGSDLDDRTLNAVAEITGGFFRKATDEDGLRGIYEKIDELEKTEIVSERYVDYKERFSGWAVPALLLLLLEAAVSNTFFRRIP